MTRYALLAFVATTLATGAGAAEGNLLDCIQERFAISGVEADAVEGTVDVTFEVTNNLTYPVGGAHVMITVTHPDRPAPIATWGSQALLTIPGGLLPGESMATATYMYVESRVQAMIDEPGQLSAVVQVESVANGDLVSIRSGLWVSSWTEGPSGDGCP